MTSLEALENFKLLYESKCKEQPKNLIGFDMCYMTIKQDLKRLEVLEKNNKLLDETIEADDKIIQQLIKENQELKEKANKYDELCKHNVMESQNFGDDLIQGILALNKRVIERNKKFIKAIKILKEYLNIEVDIDSRTIITDVGDTSIVGATKDDIEDLLLVKEMLE